MNAFIEIILSIDRTIYGFIVEVYNFIIELAGFELFDSAVISGFSKRIYALLGIFMLFKLTFSMISYIVNPDEFSDKSKGFGGLIKNVIVSMVLIVAVPYIFAEAFYVQKMILEDGTIVKMVFSKGNDEDSDRSDKTNALYGAGDQIRFILFTQFARPNEDIEEINSSCQKMYQYEDGKRVHKNGSTFAYEMDSTCKNAIESAFKTSDKKKGEDIAGYYIDAMEYENYAILVNHPELFTAKANAGIKYDEGLTKSSDVPIIKYHWFLSIITGSIALLALITMCIDIAVRSIKLGFYQIIAPIPIIANCDPKAKKDGLFQKWTKACISTYLDLFIRLLVFFLAIFIITTAMDKIGDTKRMMKVLIIIGALVFAKQAPKIIEDLTGMKMEKFTINPFKKISDEALGGKAILGAAGGALAGLIGGGGTGVQGFAARGMSSVSGALRGAAANKGFKGGINAQADVNRKVRDARINGASFWGSRLAGVASTFGLDDAGLEREATGIRKGKDIIDAERKKIDSINKGHEINKKAIERKIAPKQAIIDKQKAVVSSIESMEKKATSFIEGGKAGAYSKFYKELQGQASLLANAQSGDKLSFDVKDSSGKVKYAAGTELNAEILGEINNFAVRYAKKEGKSELVNELMHSSGNGDSANVGVNDVKDFKASQSEYEKNIEITNDLINDYNSGKLTEGNVPDELVSELQTATEYSNASGTGVHDQLGNVNNIIVDESNSIAGAKYEIEKIDRQIKANITDTKVTIDGQEMSLEEAERMIKDREEALNKKKAQSKLDRDRASAERFSGK